MKSSWRSFQNLIRNVAWPGGAKRIESVGDKPAISQLDSGRFEPQLNTLRLIYDSLTGLPLTDLFLQQARGLVENARRRMHLTGIIEIGLSDVKRVSETFGPRFADVLIRQAGFRLYSAVKPGDVLGRVGALNFAVALEAFESIEDASNVAQRLLSILDETFSLIELAEHHVRLSPRAGISIFPTHGNSAEDLLYQASIALSLAEPSGTNRIELFSAERQEESKVRLKLEWMLRRALEEKEFRLSYQPEIDLRSNRVVRREALLRWPGSPGGAISPASFIPIAEQTGLIVPLGTWVLEEACRQAREWQREEGSSVGVAVNVSAVQISQGDFVAKVEAALRNVGLEAESLELELTESALIGDRDRSFRQVSELRELGVSVVIDDFGAGYSSLSYLKELPVNGVKLDRSFLRDLQRNPNTLPILRSIVSLAHGLNMRVTVEGVEAEDELDAIRKLGVDTAQGYLLGRPESQSLKSAAAKGG